MGPFAYGPGPVPFSSQFGWTSSRIEQVRHFKHWVYVAVSRISAKIASSQPMVSVVRDKKPSGTVSDLGRFYSKALTQLQERESLEPLDSDHRLVRLLNDANPYDTAFDIWWETTVFLELTGSAYWWLPKDALGLPCEIWVIPSHWMWPVFGRDGKTLIGWSMRPVEGSPYEAQLPEDEIIHFKVKNPLSKIDGQSALAAGAQWVDCSEAVDFATLQSYRNGSLPQLQIEIDPGIADPNEPQLERIHARIQSRYSGGVNAGRPMILPPGFKAKPLTLQPTEMLLGESADRCRDNTLALFGVNKVIAGLVEKMTFGANLAAMQIFCAFKINPRLTYQGQMLTEKLAAKFDPRIRIWWPDSTPEDPASREREILTDIKAGAITKNEVRAIRGRKPWPPEVGDVLATSADGRGQTHGTGDRNPTYQSEEDNEHDDQSLGE